RPPGDNNRAMSSFLNRFFLICAVRGHAVSETLVAFMVKAVVLDPRNGFNVDRILTKQDVQKLEEVSLVLNYFFSL
uniref:Uncharacterized protein n=1 Tax=Labrus bergylta TaxID=56723 RepID=A0A3Q3E5Q7_9LABR